MFSFVAWVCDQAEGIEEFHNRLLTAADKLNGPYEVIYVDDGSNDDTPSILRRLADADARVKIVELTRSFGSQAAIAAGHDHAAGRAVVSLSGQCGHPPEIIGELVARWREGFEVVQAIRKGADRTSLGRGAVNGCVRRAIGWLTGTETTAPDDFRLLDRKVVDALAAHRECRLLGKVVDRLGFRQTAVPYVAEEHAGQEPRRSLSRPFGAVAAEAFNFSLRPVRLAGALGGLMVAAATVYLIISLVLWPLGKSASIWAHAAMFIVGMFGLQFILLWLVGEYVASSFEQARSQPLYVVRDKVGFPEADQHPPDGTDETETQRFTVFT